MYARLGYLLPNTNREAWSHETINIFEQFINKILTTVSSFSQRVDRNPEKNINDPCPISFLSGTIFNTVILMNFIVRDMIENCVSRASSGLGIKR